MTQRNLSIDAIEAEYGDHPAILPLNGAFRRNAPTIKLTLTVEWRPDDPTRALAVLESQLAEVSPTLRHHQCRGPHQYRVFEAHGGSTPVEPALALAHLIEHVMIDSVAYVSRAPRVSGITAGLVGRPGTYDVFVECPDVQVAQLAIAVALSWVETVLRGGTLDMTSRLALEVARILFGQWQGPVRADLAARAMGHPREEIESAFLALERVGFLRREQYTQNFSGIPSYQVPRASDASVARGCKALPRFAA